MDKLLSLCAKTVELHDTDIHPDTVDRLVEMADTITNHIRATQTLPRSAEDFLTMMGRQDLPEDIQSLLDSAELVVFAA